MGKPHIASQLSSQRDGDLNGRGKHEVIRQGQEQWRMNLCCGAKSLPRNSYCMAPEGLFDYGLLGLLMVQWVAVAEVDVGVL